MSKTAHHYKDDKPGAELPSEAPTGQVSDSSYKTDKNEPVPVVGDDDQIEDPMKLGNADSDKQLGMPQLFSFASSTSIVIRSIFRHDADKRAV